MTLMRLTKQFLRYRTVALATANAVITWIILIIAPLGLFAVIVCTAGVFFSSLVLGQVADTALLRVLAAQSEIASLSTSSDKTVSVWSSLTAILTDETKTLDERKDPPQFPRS